jgi:hypothetical protein
VPRSPRGSGSSRRPSSEAGTARGTAGPRSRAAPATTPGAGSTGVTEPSPSERPAAAADTAAAESPAVAGQAAQRGTTDGLSPPRFRIFIIDSGWNSAAHRVLQENFGLIRELQREDPIYVLTREQSIEFLRYHQDRIGREPIIAVHDLAAMSESGTDDFHGFRLHLGLMHSSQQALAALQNFVRFVSTHRQSIDLEAEIRRDLRREGMAGAIEIILAREAREIGE